MNSLKKVSVTAVAGLAMALTNMPANAVLVFQFDDILTGPAGTSTLGGIGGNDYLTSTVTNNGTGVDIGLALFVDYPSEFITHIRYNLNRTVAVTANPIQTPSAPDISGDSCPGSSPGGITFELCFRFAPSTHAAQPASISFFIDSIQESNFVSSSGWFAVAHVQGIEPDCSSWVGARTEGTANTTPYVAPDAGGTCSVSVPEPKVTSLLGLGLVALLGAGIANARRRRRLLA